MRNVDVELLKTLCAKRDRMRQELDAENRWDDLDEEQRDEYLSVLDDISGVMIGTVLELQDPDEVCRAL